MGMYRWYLAISKEHLSFVKIAAELFVVNVSNKSSLKLELSDPSGIPKRA